MPPKPECIYWDSCVYISCIQQDPARYPVLRAFLGVAESRKIFLVASALVVAEVVKLNCSPEPINKQADLIREFFENDYIEVRSVDRAIAEEAAKICRSHDIRPPDAVHVATALKFQCTCLQTYDGENPKPKGKYLLPLDGKVGWPALKIELPQVHPFQSQRGLFDP